MNMISFSLKGETEVTVTLLRREASLGAAARSQRLCRTLKATLRCSYFMEGTNLSQLFIDGSDSLPEHQPMNQNKRHFQEQSQNMDIAPVSSNTLLNDHQ